MAVQIRLARHGSKKSPFYRVVVTDKRNPRDGRFIESIGTYNPNSSPAVFSLRDDRLQHWMQHGAQTSATLARLVKTHRQGQGTAG